MCNFAANCNCAIGPFAQCAKEQFVLLQTRQVCGSESKSVLLSFRAGETKPHATCRDRSLLSKSFQQDPNLMRQPLAGPQSHMLVVRHLDGQTLCTSLCIRGHQTQPDKIFGSGSCWNFQRNGSFAQWSKCTNQLCRREI